MGMQSKPEQNVKTRWFAFQRVGIHNRPLYIKECANESSCHFFDAHNLIHKTSTVVSSSHNDEQLSSAFQLNGRQLVSKSN